MGSYRCLLIQEAKDIFDLYGSTEERPFSFSDAWWCIKSRESSACANNTKSKMNFTILPSSTDQTNKDIFFFFRLLLLSGSLQLRYYRQPAG